MPVIVHEVVVSKRLRQAVGGLPENPWPIAFAPDGKAVVVGNLESREVRLWPGDGKARTVAKKEPGQYRGAAFSPDGKTLALAFSHMDKEQNLSGEVLLWDV